MYEWQKEVFVITFGLGNLHMYIYYIYQIQSENISEYISDKKNWVRSMLVTTSTSLAYKVKQQVSVQDFIVILKELLFSTIFYFIFVI